MHERTSPAFTVNLKSQLLEDIRTIKLARRGPIDDGNLHDVVEYFRRRAAYCHFRRMSRFRWRLWRETTCRRIITVVLYRGEGGPLRSARCYSPRFLRNVRRSGASIAISRRLHTNSNLHHTTFVPFNYIETQYQTYFVQYIL